MNAKSFWEFTMVACGPDFATIPNFSFQGLPQSLHGRRCQGTGSFRATCPNRTKCAFQSCGPLLKTIYTRKHLYLIIYLSGSVCFCLSPSVSVCLCLSLPVSVCLRLSASVSVCVCQHFWLGHVLFTPAPCTLPPLNWQDCSGFSFRTGAPAPLT